MLSRSGLRPQTVLVSVSLSDENKTLFSFANVSLLDFTIKLA